ncbi:hypothetical protein TNCV_2238141 [Trichonephila clavipes]|nr:hypothetical protein TNCV_2238141 [Trichonephila clavipes]
MHKSCFITEQHGAGKVHICRNAQMRQFVGNPLAVISALSVHETDVRLHPEVQDGQFLEICRLQWQAPVHWYRDFGPQYATHSI